MNRATFYSSNFFFYFLKHILFKMNIDIVAKLHLQENGNFVILFFFFFLISLELVSL